MRSLHIGSMHSRSSRGFWVFTVVYIIRWFFPAMQVELVLPP